MTQMSIKGKFATDDDTERRRMAALEIRKRLAKEEGLALETTRKVYIPYQVFYLLSLLGQIQLFYLSIALCDILGQSPCRPDAYLAPFKRRPF